VSRRGRVPGMRKNVLFVLPSIPDDASDELKNALAIRNTCATEGRCPACGVEPTLDLDAYGIHHLTFRHDDDCPCLLDSGTAA
jgi:hypothetical protein